LLDAELIPTWPLLLPAGRRMDVPRCESWLPDGSRYIL
jgi:hypothetical protein